MTLWILISRLFIILFLLSECSHIQRYEVPSSVQPHINKFQEEGKKQHLDIRITNLIVQFESLERPTIGECYDENWSNGSPKLVLDPDYWKTAFPLERETLIFHELGHCYLGRDHDDTILSTGIHKSLMSSTLIPTKEYKSNKDYYSKELFENAQIERPSTIIDFFKSKYPKYYK